MPGFFSNIAHAIRQPKAERLDIIDGNAYRSADSWTFHIFEKTVLHVGLRFIRTPPPEQWPALLTGSRKDAAEFLLKEYFPHEKQARREIILEKILWYTLKMWEYDENYAEVFDYLVWKLQGDKDLSLTFDPTNLNPAFWYMDANPHPALNGKPGRVIPALTRTFSVIRQTDAKVYTSAPVTSSLLTVWDTDSPGTCRFLVIDPRKGGILLEEGAPVWHYPVILETKDLMAVAPALRMVRDS